MKAFLTLVLLNLLSFGLFGQVGIKGVYLGTNGVGQDVIMETVEGISGTIIPRLLNDGRIYYIAFIPGEPLKPKGINVSELEGLISGFENQFKSKFRYFPKGEGGKAGFRIADFSQDGRMYSVSITVRETLDENLEHTLMISVGLWDKELAGIRHQEYLGSDI